MTDWQTTAKTIYCSAVDDEITIIISKDFSTRCTGYKKYTEQNEVTLRMIKQKNRKSKRTIRCEGEQCPHIIAYKEKIMSEESKK